MRIPISPLALAVVGLATMLPAVPADAATPERMMAELDRILTQGAQRADAIARPIVTQARQIMGMVTAQD